MQALQKEKMAAVTNLAKHYNWILVESEYILLIYSI